MSDSDDITMAVKMGPKCFPEIAELASGMKLERPETFHALCDFIDRRLDCADFRLSCIIRALYAYSPQINEPELRRAKETVLGFRYWMDEPGEDSMCFWSENHQILFATCEYLAGVLYPQELFTNNRMTGRQRVEHARPRIVNWLADRARYGYIEWHSNVYYEEDVAPLCLLVDFAPDDDLVRGARQALDLLFLDMAMHSWRGLFCATSGRCYEVQKKHPLQADTLELSDSLAGTGRVHEPDWSRLSAHFHLSGYRVPDAVGSIARATHPAVIRDSMGLDLDEVDSEFPDKSDLVHRGMVLWAMEAFTNPQAISDTMKIMSSWNLNGNRFLSGLQPLAHPLLMRLRLHPLISRVLNPSTNGVAIERANTYTYRTADYMLSTAVRYRPGAFGDQQHIWQATLGDDQTVFTTHPGAPMFDDNARNFSPAYWVGNGIQPHAAQYRNVVLLIYRTGGRRGYLERPRVRFSHAWFPRSHFQETSISERCACAAVGEAYLALHAARPIETDPDHPHELIQRGRNTAWVCELGTTAEWGSFQEFCQSMEAAVVRFTGRRLSYRCARPTTDQSRGFTLRYRGAFRIDGRSQAQTHPRLESPWGDVERRPGRLRIEAGGHVLEHDYGEREEA